MGLPREWKDDDEETRYAVSAAQCLKAERPRSCIGLGRTRCSRNNWKPEGRQLSTHLRRKIVEKIERGGWSRMGMHVRALLAAQTGELTRLRWLRQTGCQLEQLLRMNPDAHRTVSAISTLGPGGTRRVGDRRGAALPVAPRDEDFGVRAD
jgi:hypothetical protein